MHIDKALAQLAEKQDVYSVNLDKTWGQGRTTYGGMSAGLIYKAIENEIEDERMIRSFHCNFIGPLDFEQPIEVSARVIRTGKNVTQLVGEASQNGKVATMAQACFGHSRESKLDLRNNHRHDMPKPKKAKFIPQIPKIVPKFLQHFELSLEKGALALAGNKDADLFGWSRFKQPPSEMTMAHLITMMDCWPPTMLQMLRLPAAASTMSWNLEFIHPEIALDTDGWMASQCSAHHIQDGYGHEEGSFWDKNGNLIAISRQVVTIFA